MAGAFSIHAFIICWTGKEESARHIAHALAPHVAHLTVIYSNNSNILQEGAGEWVMVPDDWFYGKKFVKCLELHRGQIMLQIQADAQYDNWPQVIKRCQYAYQTYRGLGVWAPDVDYTHFTLDKVILGTAPGGEHAMVAQTDGIVWSISPPVLQRLREFNYEQNNLGWGMDWAAASFALAHNMLVLRDLTIKIGHPKGSGYDMDLAATQQRQFLMQMLPQELVQYALLSAYVNRPKH